MTPTYIVTKTDQQWAVVAVSVKERTSLASFERFSDACRYLRGLRQGQIQPPAH